jgi:hypothetical protein
MNRTAMDTPLNSLSPADVAFVRNWIASHDWGVTVTLHSGGARFSEPDTGHIADDDVKTFADLRIWAGY